MAHNKKIFESLGYECINKMGTNDYPLNPMNTDEFNNYHILKKQIEVLLHQLLLHQLNLYLFHLHNKVSILFYFNFLNF